MRVEFKRGRKIDLPPEANVGILHYAWDTGEVYEGNGKGKPLTKYASIFYGYSNLADLEKKNPKITGKIYITLDGDMYIYNGKNYLLVNGERKKDSTTLYELHWNNEQFNSLTKIVDFRDLFNDKKMKSIDKAEILIQNKKGQSSVNAELQLIIFDKDIKVLDVLIEPQDTQRYILGISPNVKIFTKGRFSGQLYINYFELSEDELGGDIYY